MKCFGFALLLACSTAAFVAPAGAWPYIDVTASEALSVDPPRYRTTFDLSFVGYEPGGYYGFTIAPLASAPAVVLYDCQAPPSWRCGDSSPHPPGEYHFFDDSSGPRPPVLTFSIVTDRAEPCVEIDFLDPVLAKRPSLNWGPVIEACLVVDAPVPALRASWGSVKSLYR